MAALSEFGSRSRKAIVRKAKAVLIHQYFQLIFTDLSSFFLQKISEQLSNRPQVVPFSDLSAGRAKKSKLARRD